MQLSNMLVDKLEAWIPYDGIPGFEVKLAHLSREELTKVRKACTTKDYDPKARAVVEKVDDELFMETFTKATVLDWKGLTIKGAQRLLPMKSDKDDTTEVPFSVENAVTMVKSSPAFDDWVNSLIFDLDIFRRSGKVENPS